MRAWPPQLATLVEAPPEGERWSFEIKYDGYRALAYRDDGGIVLRSRNGLAFDGLEGIRRRLARLSASSFVLDGELCVLDDGRPSFERLQAALGAGDDEAVVYFVFDLLALDGEDLRRLPLADRQAHLKRLVKTTDRGPVRRVVSHRGSGAAFLEATRSLGLEGMIAKRSDRPHRSGRSRDWLKVKTEARAELIIVGFTPPSTTRAGLGALLLGVHEGGALRYAGKVGSGFDAATSSALASQLRAIEVSAPCVIDPPKMRGARWVRPALIAEVRFSEWTSQGRLRHPVFLGLRGDKHPSHVTRERTARG